MTAIRSVRAAEGKFVQISNAALQDERLSWSARGILAFVLSLPPDQHLTAAWLEKQSPDGRREVRSALRELERYGYYLRSRRSDGRRWIWEQVISDAPMTAEDGASSQVDPSDRFASDGKPSDGNRSDKRPNTEDPKDVGPVDLASRRARAKAASAPRTIQDAIDGVRAAVVATNSQADADDLTNDECMGLYWTYVKGRRPTDIAAYLTAVFGSAPYIETFLSNSEPWCCRCSKWESQCECPAAYAGGDC